MALKNDGKSRFRAVLKRYVSHNYPIWINGNGISIIIIYLPIYRLNSQYEFTAQGKQNCTLSDNDFTLQQPH